ncbi:killer cell lectin-like receptor subfamily G member 2 isoform X1 [Monodelphis domestica]|uniref:killer cell lectin-like receptor subfamily G member 2 isoform X1 n=2 Tax=Monodelphis domestica TaxID=13616 RepID=UPI0024E1BA23|nr:killer cell lectin-like receptor subfamily G member 2 isoform X1 [Monodelphis domestica]
MVRHRASLEEGMAGAEFPMEPIQNQAQEQEKLGAPEQQVAGEQQPPLEQPELGKKPDEHPQGPKEQAAGSPATTRNPLGEKPLSLRPTFLRVPQPSLGYGSFRCRGSSSSEQLQGRGDREGTLALVPVPAPAESQPREGEPSTPGAARDPGEAGSGAWTPVELQVDVRVKPVGTAVSGLSPSPLPTTRFFSVTVPDSPAFSRHSSISRSGVSLTPSPGSTWGGSPHPLTNWADRYREQEGRASPGLARSRESPSELPRCRCRELGLGDKEWEKLLPGCGADGDKLHQAIARIGLPTYMKSLRWSLVVMAVLLAMAVITLVVLASRTGMKCQPCPEGWMWSEEHCYYHSLEVQSWEDSKAFCSAHQASLPLLSHSKKFLSSQIYRLYWVGLYRGPEGWHWIDGAPLHPQLLPEEDEGSLQNRNCGGLEAGRLKALECASSRPWICVREAK